MCMGGGGGDTTVTQTNIPWEGAEPHLTDIYGKIGDTYMPAVYDAMQWAEDEGMSPWSVFSYPHDRVAGMSDAQQEGMQLTKDFSRNFTENLQTPADMLLQTMQGDYLNPESNPYLQQYVEAAQQPMIDNYLQNIVPTMDNQAVSSGRYGSGIWGETKAQAAEDLNKQLGYTAAQMYAPAYESERERQMSAVPGLNDVFNQAFKHAGYLTATGEAEQGQQQAEINAEMQKWMEDLYGPLDWANVVSNLFLSGGALGRTSDTTYPYQGPNLSQSLLGSGSSLAGLLADLGVF